MSGKSVLFLRRTIQFSEIWPNTVHDTSSYGIDNSRLFLSPSELSTV